MSNKLELKRIVFALSFLFSALLVAQNTNPNQRLNFGITFLENAPILDGNILKESLWKNIPVITDLEQIKPNYGAPVSEKTEIRVAFSTGMFYVAVVCFDSNPESIVVSDSRRDSDLNDEDSFLFIIDTFIL